MMRPTLKKPLPHSRKNVARYRHAVSSPLGRVTAGAYLTGCRGVREPRRFGQYAVVYLVAGQGRFWDELGTCAQVKAGDGLLVFPEISHTYGPVTGNDWSEFYLAFEGPVFDLWRERGLLNPARPLFRAEPVPTWLRRLQSIQGGGASTPLAEVCALQTLLVDLLHGSARGAAGQEEARWAAEACALLEDEKMPSAEAPACARRMGVSYATFRQRFTRLVGESPARYQTARRVDRACELMQNTTLADKEIAARLGFCDEFYFSRRFKQITGRSPREFRRSLPTSEVLAER